MYCGKCGSRISGDSKYCGFCGSPVFHASPLVQRLDHPHPETTVDSSDSGPSVSKLRPPVARLTITRALIALGIILASCVLIIVNALIIGVEGFDGSTLLVAGIASLVPALFYATLVVLLDVREREPIRILALAFLWGAFIAMTASYILNSGIFIVAAVAFGSELAEIIATVLAAPFVEETAKGAGLIAILFLFRREFNNVTDGIVYGALIGIGFGMTENMLYLGGAHLQGEAEEFALLFYVRAILGGLGHAGYTALIGAGLGYFKETDAGHFRLAAPVVGFIAAVLGHASWNGIFAVIIGFVLIPENDFLYYVVVPFVVFLGMLPGYLALFVLLLRSWRREADVILHYLEDEVRNGLLTSHEHQRLRSVRQRFSYELHALTQSGVRSWLAARQFHQKSTRFAFHKWQVARGDRPTRSGIYQDLEFREQIRALRTHLPPTAA
jgi:protease PrsW